MTADDVVRILEALEGAGLTVWVDGGWGVDALAGQVTRAHSDLDLAVDVRALPEVRRILGANGFRHAEDVEPGLPARLVLVDDAGRQVDVHPLELDEAGNGWQRLSETGRAWGRYPAEDLGAEGSIGGRKVLCLSAGLQLRFHLGYEWDEPAEHDVRLLLTELGLGPLPPVLGGPGQNLRGRERRRGPA